MPDTPATGRTTTRDEPWDPARRRDAVRLISIYAAPWHLRAEHRRRPTRASRHLRLEPLEDYLVRSTAQLPHVLHQADLTTADLTFASQVAPAAIIGARLWLFVTPPSQIVVAFSLDVDRELPQTIDLLEDCFYVDVRYGEVSIEEAAAKLAERHGCDTSKGLTFYPDRHQLAFGPALPLWEADDIIQRVVYRSDLPYHHEFSTIGYPPELNRSPGTAAAVGASVSLLCGHREYVEDSVFLSAVQAVAGAAWLRDIRQKAYSAVEMFRDGQRAHGDPRERRRALWRLSNQLVDMELDLSYGVEAGADLGLLAPLLRVADYHEELYEVTGLVAKAEAVTRMLRRLDRAINAELTTIESIERRVDDNRRLRWAVSVGFVSAVSVPIGLVFTFFGGNAREIDGSRSMLDLERYLPVYLSAVGVALVGVLIFAGFHLYQRFSLHRDLRHAAWRHRRWRRGPRRGTARRPDGGPR